MKNYLIQKTFYYSNTKSVKYFDSYLEQFTENKEKKPLKKLYTKHFKSEKECLEVIKKYKNKFLNKNYFKNCKIIEIEV